MNEFSVDLSLRSTGVSWRQNDKLEDFALVCNSKDKDEVLLIRNVEFILNWISCKAVPSKVRIEGLSFGSKSGSKDSIAGQFWYLRCELKKKWPNVEIEIVPVTSWRSPLFNKEERKQLAEAKKEYAKSKKSLKGKKGLERQEVQAKNKELELLASVKEATWEKLDEDLQRKILSYILVNDFEDESRYDICDSIMLGQFKKK